MTVRDLIKELIDYDLDAEIKVTANNKNYKPTITYGDFEGCSKNTCSYVYFYVEETMNNPEQETIQ